VGGGGVGGGFCEVPIGCQPQGKNARVLTAATVKGRGRHPAGIQVKKGFLRHLKQAKRKRDAENF